MELVRLNTDNVYKYKDYEIIFKSRGKYIVKKILGINKKSIKIDYPDLYNNLDPVDETTRRHHASLLLTDYIINNRLTENVIILGDFNNVGGQNTSNPAISPFVDNINFNYGSHFKMMDLNILTGSEELYSWQGWTSSYNPAHFDHIIITKPLFTYVDSSIIGVIDTPMETGLSLTRVSNTISDHKPGRATLMTQTH